MVKGKAKMGFKQRVAGALMQRLPADEQRQLVADVIAWRLTDISEEEQRQHIERLGPGLLEMMRQGRVGLALLVTRHLMRLPPLRWLARATTPTGAGSESPAVRSAS
jgi:hypothetical protein